MTLLSGHCWKLLSIFALWVGNPCSAHVNISASTVCVTHLSCQTNDQPCQTQLNACELALQVALLRFSPAEKSFYDHILDKTAAASQQLQQQQQAAAAAQQQQQQEVLTGGSSSEASTSTAVDQAGCSTTRAHHVTTNNRHNTRHKRGRQQPSTPAAAASSALDVLAAAEVLQLRLACVHPQLTRYWKELSAELQLGQVADEHTNVLSVFCTLF